MISIEEFYGLYYERLLKYIAKLMRKSKFNPDVQDVSSDTWAKVFLKWDQCYADNNKGRYGWVCQIARHVRLRRIEKEIRRNTIPVDPHKIYVSTFSYPYSTDFVIDSSKLDGELKIIVEGLGRGDTLKEIAENNGWKGYRPGYIKNRHTNTLKDELR